jgi:hypothetical protein
MKRINDTEEAYAAMHDALDKIKACQAFQNRTAALSNRATTALAEARTALDVAAQDIEANRPRRRAGGA